MHIQECNPEPGPTSHLRDGGVSVHEGGADGPGPHSRQRSLKDSGTSGVSTLPQSFSKAASVGGIAPTPAKHGQALSPGFCECGLS